MVYHFHEPIHDGFEMAFPETEWFYLKKFFVAWRGKRLPVRKELAGKGRLYLMAGHSFPSPYLFVIPASRSRAGNRIMINQYEYRAPRFTSPTKSPLWPAYGRYVEYILVTGGEKTLDRLKISGFFCQIPLRYRKSATRANL